MGVLLATLIVYFYAHYALASITAHMLAMFPPFVTMLIGLGTPPRSPSTRSPAWRTLPPA